MSYNPDSALGRLEKRQRMRPTTNAVDPADAIRLTYSRQVQRQRARLAKKGRTDAPPAWMLETTERRGARSKYMPHNGKREMERRSRKFAA